MQKCYPVSSISYVLFTRTVADMLASFLKSKIYVKLVSIFDILFALTILAPLVVVFWATSWMLYDLFLFPDDPVISGGISWSFGFCGQFILMYNQEALKKHLILKKWPLFSILILKVYALFLAHTFVSFWRGVWSVVDATSSKQIGVVIMNILQNSLALMFLKVFRNTLVPPFFVAIDHPEQYSMKTLLEKNVRHVVVVQYCRTKILIFNFNWRKLTEKWHIWWTV